ncbi:MAG TPA: hypothetical protein VFN60_04655 [Acidimicrobiales bacterium]|nr:hypothetical protein [Acidimicrobiales bacterium]
MLDSLLQHPGAGGHRPTPPGGTVDDHRAGNPATLAAGGAPAVAGPVTVPEGC